LDSLPKRGGGQSELSYRGSERASRLSKLFERKSEVEAPEPIKKKYIKRPKDLGNPRYAASQHSSFIGGMITGMHQTDVITVASALQDEPIKEEDKKQEK
jgi:hypothetical protein